MLVKIYWNVLFENDNDIINGFDLVEIEKNEYDKILNRGYRRGRSYPLSNILLG